MHRLLLNVCYGVFLWLTALNPSHSAADANIAISRLDCGSIRVNLGRLFSDAFTYDGEQFPLVESCYLVRHGDKYLLWDTGLPFARLGEPHSKTAPISMVLDTTISSQLSQVELKPSDIDYVAISHFHPDHTGQLSEFENATLLIGQADWAVLTGQSLKGARLARKEPFAHWLKGPGTVVEIAKDKDVFGDGSVVILATPGHTPGHKSLLVRLSHDRVFLITGDAAHRVRNLDEALVPVFNTDRADTLASIARLKRIREALQAEIVIQHEPAHVDAIPAFPNWTP